MIFESKSHLTFEMMKIKRTLKDKDAVNIKKFYEQYLEMMAIPKKEIHKNRYLTFCSSKVSYHLLCIYLLLDVIDFYWDGSTFFERELKSDYSLMEELSVTEKTEDLPFHTIIEHSDKISSIIRDDLYVFLVPYKYKHNYSVKIAYPGNVLLLYANDKDTIVESFYEGVGEFYLNKKLKGKLPYWANNKDFFKKEFVAWCKNENSLFKNR